MIQQANMFQMTQQINKNSESGRVFTEHLFVRLYSSSWDFDECDIRFLQEDWIKKNTYTLILSLSLFLLLRLQHLPTSTLPPLSEKKVKAAAFIFITTQTPFPRHPPHSSVSLTHILFLHPFPTTCHEQLTQKMRIKNVRFVWRGMEKEARRVCVWSGLLVSGG